MEGLEQEARNEVSKDIISYLQDRFGDTHKQIGEKIGVSEGFVYGIELGKGYLCFEHLDRIVKAYNTDLAIILRGSIDYSRLPGELDGLVKDVLDAAIELRKSLDNQL